MKPPTTGEIDFLLALANEAETYGGEFGKGRATGIRDAINGLRPHIDAAIAAERERIAAFCEANPTKYGDQIAEMIRARNDQ